MLVMMGLILSCLAPAPAPACVTVSCWESTNGPETNETEVRDLCAVLGEKRGKHVIDDDVLSQIRSIPAPASTFPYTICIPASPSGACQAFCGEPWTRLIDQPLGARHPPTT